MTVITVTGAYDCGGTFDFVGPWQNAVPGAEYNIATIGDNGPGDNPNGTTAFGSGSHWEGVWHFPSTWVATVAPYQRHIALVGRDASGGHHLIGTAWSLEQITTPPAFAGTMVEGAFDCGGGTFDFVGPLVTVIPGRSYRIAVWDGNGVADAENMGVAYGDSGGSGGTDAWHFPDSFVTTVPGGQTQMGLIGRDGTGGHHLIGSAWSYELLPLAPVAAFSGTALTGGPRTVAFTDATTENPTSWAWDFGDSGTSTEQNPSHAYATPGTYTVTLTATNAAGSDGETKVGYVTVTVAPPVAAFSGDQLTGGERDVEFTDESTGTPTSWLWDFDDGDTSTEQNPTHHYTPGLYSPILTATNAGGDDDELKVDYITVTAPPVAAFHANHTSGVAPLTVQFTDDSTGSPTVWTWDFGDGVYGVPGQGQSYQYVVAGVYDVALSVDNDGGNDVETKVGYITVTAVVPPPPPPPPPDIIADPFPEDRFRRGSGTPQQVAHYMATAPEWRFAADPLAAVEYATAYAISAQASSDADAIFWTDVAVLLITAAGNPAVEPGQALYDLIRTYFPG